MSLPSIRRARLADTGEVTLRIDGVELVMMLSGGGLFSKTRRLEIEVLVMYD
jgi:hypothetical protein